MNKDLFCHTVATETAKVFTTHNMPEYVNMSGCEGFAKDFAEKYYEGYKIAENYYNDNPCK